MRPLGASGEILSAKLLERNRNTPTRGRFLFRELTRKFADGITGIVRGYFHFLDVPKVRGLAD